MRLTGGKYIDQLRFLNKYLILMLNVLFSSVYIVFAQVLQQIYCFHWYSFKKKNIINKTHLIWTLPFSISALFLFSFKFWENVLHLTLPCKDRKSYLPLLPAFVRILGTSEKPLLTIARKTGFLLTMIYHDCIKIYRCAQVKVQWKQKCRYTI